MEDGREGPDCTEPCILAKEQGFGPMTMVGPLKGLKQESDVVRANIRKSSGPGGQGMDFRRPTRRLLQ